MGAGSELFDFWKNIDRGQKVHPADKGVFNRMHPERHGFQLQCMPACFAGPLLTAPVVLLYLSPGYERGEDAHAESESGQDYYWRRWRGLEPLPDRDTPGTKWVRERTAKFGEYALVRNKVAIFNIGAYHSIKMESFASMLALPSSRVALNWAQDYLFPEAESGRRVVVCMRSAAYWGLEPNKAYAGTLFAPMTTRGGHLLKRPQYLEIVERIREAVET
jgi:hypothetical protein